MTRRSFLERYPRVGPSVLVIVGAAGVVQLVQILGWLA